MYLFSAVIALWTGRYFFTIWKKNQYDPYWEFSMFFSILGIAFLIYPTFLIISDFAGVLGDSLVLFAFAFVLRAFVRFQDLPLSPSVVTTVVNVISGMFFTLALYFPGKPVMDNWLIYWHYPLQNSATFGAILFCSTLAAAFTLLSNIRNIQKHKKPMLFLGLAFLIGGSSGVVIHNFNTFGFLFFGYSLLLITFVFTALFVVTSSHKNE